MIDENKLMEEVRRWKRKADKDCGEMPNASYLTGYLSALSVVEGMIAEQPTVDAVEVVRCCQCKYSEKYKCEVYPTYNPLVCRRREYYSEGVDGYDFCSYGERKVNKVNLEDIVDLDAQTKANNEAMQRVFDFIV